MRLRQHSTAASPRAFPRLQLAGPSLCAGLSVLVAVQASMAPDVEFDSRAATAWVERLASQEMKGRRSGTQEGDRAAQIIAAEFKRLGLVPAGDQGSFLQGFQFPGYRIVPPARLSLVEPGGDEEELRYADDYFFVTGSGTSTGRARVVFAGYGITTEEHDDYDGLSVRDCIVVVLEGTRPGMVVPASARSNLAKARHARAVGARGLFTIPDAEHPGPLTRERIWVLRPENFLDGFVFGRLRALAADRMFGVATSSLKTAIDAGLPAPAAKPKVIAWQSTSVFDRQARAANVLARWPGTDARLANEAIVLGAHYDGGGVDPDGTIYPGAEDNASGTAALLEVARVLTGGPRPRRPVIFAAWGAEEQGAWGSRHYVADPATVASTALTLTMDNVGVGTGTFRLFGARNFPDEYRIVASAINPQTADGFAPRGAGGSDGYTFQVLGIPSFFSHADAPQLHVHTPADRPDTITPISLERVGRFMTAATLAGANAVGPLTRSDRLARYLLRDAVLVGWTRSSSPDWASLRERGIDIAIVEVGSDGETVALQRSVESHATVVTRPGDLTDDEEGTPIRVLVVRGPRGARAPAAIESDLTVLLGANQVQSRPLRVTPKGWEFGDLRLFRVSSGTLQAVLANASELARDEHAALVFDLDDPVEARTLIDGLLRAGVDGDGIEALFGTRFQRSVSSLLSQAVAGYTPRVR
jgi:hypothetical protein